MADVKLIPKLTQKGLQALFDADKNEIKIKITHIGFGEGAYKPTGLETSLKDEKIRVPVLSAKTYPDLGMIDFSTIVPKDNVPNFWIREIGFYDENGVLIFVWSDPEVIIAQKTQFIELLQGLRVYLTEADVGLIEVVEAEPDIKLLYFEEFLNIANSILNLSNSVVRTNIKLFDTQKLAKENNKRIEKLETQVKTLNDIAFQNKDKLEKLTELSIALLIQNITLSTKLVELELQLKKL